MITDCGIRARSLLITILLGALCALPGLVYAQTVSIEAEGYAEYLDIGAEPIQVVLGVGCSGGYYLLGLDYPEEWTEYEIEIGTPGAYSAGIRCRGDLGIPYHLTLLLENAGGEPQVIDFSFTGQGYG